MPETVTPDIPFPSNPARADAFPDILSLLRGRALADPKATAIEDAATGAVQSYGALLRRVEILAGQIAARSGTVGRPRIAIVMPNGGAFSEVLLAVAVVGTALPFNPAFTEAEFESYFLETELDLLVTVTGYAPIARRVAQRLGIQTLDLDSLPKDAPIPDLPPPSPDDVALVLLTSGSTGRAKRVPLSHRNVCTAARDVSVSLHLAPEDRCLSMWELFHVGGLVDLLLAPLHSGGTVIATSGFDATKFFDLLSQRRPTWFQAVPTALGELGLVAARNGYDAGGQSLRFLRSVAAALSPSLMAEIETLFRVPVLQTFGMTEASPLICSTGFDASDRLPGSVGRSCGTEISIFDANWTQQGRGVEGEVAIRGPNVFSGYEADPAANEAAFRDGWFRTGDLGRVDAEGRLFLTGRIKELVNRGGEKVNLREVDDALLAHQAVYEAAAFPVPHRNLGEDVAAAVVLRPNAVITATELRQALASRLAAFKIPRQIIFLTALPRNAVGKIDRRQLATVALADTGTDAHPPAAPETTLETQLASIWARELGVASVGLDADFVRLGGDSLAALRVLLAVETETGLSLPDDVLSRLSTIRDMAKMLVSEGKSPSAAPAAVGITHEELRQIQAVISIGKIPVLRPGSTFKVINSAGTKPPLIWFFNRPATEMHVLQQSMPPDRPVYGGFSGGKLFDMDDAPMERLAQHYAAELLREFPTGAYVLGGNCKGARVAWEVAKLLDQAGRKVDRLCLLEYSHRNLHHFASPMLLMFGKHSRQKAYRPIGWGETGWQSAFAVPPVVSWINGTHGGFFRSDTTALFVETLCAFLDGHPKIDGTLGSPDGRRVMKIHGSWLRFNLFRAFYKVSVRLRHGRRIRYDPFTGEARR